MSGKKKQGFFSRLFGSKPSEEDNSEKKKHQRSANNEVAPRPPASNKATSVGVEASAAVKPHRQTSASGGKKSSAKGRRLQKRLSRKKTKKTGSGDLDMIDTSAPLEYPTTPEMILAHHKKKPFLNNNEEWLVVELNEFECLVDSLEIIKMIADHSKYFEIEPDELWEEFFEFVEEMPSYDEVINFDVWQEFRDEKYPC